MNFSLKVTQKSFRATLSPLQLSVLTGKRGAVHSRGTATGRGAFGLTGACWHSGGKVDFVSLKRATILPFRGKNNLQNRSVTAACLQSADSSSFIASAYDLP